MPPHAKNFPFRRQIRTNFGSSFNDKQEYLQTSMKNLYILRNLVSTPCSCLENARGPTLLSKGKTQGLGCIPREAKMGGASLVTKTFLLETANWTNRWSRLVEPTVSCLDSLSICLFLGAFVAKQITITCLASYDTHNNSDTFQELVQKPQISNIWISFVNPVLHCTN